MRPTSAKQWARLYGRWQLERLMVLRFGLQKTAPSLVPKPSIATLP